MSELYPPSGVLFYQGKKRSDKSPDFNGYVELDREMLSSLAAHMDENGRAKLKLAGWNRTSAKSGKDFVSIKPEVDDGSFEGKKQQETQQKKQLEIPDRLQARSTGIPDMDDEIPF